MDYTVIDATDSKGVRNVISNRLVVTGYTSIAGQGLVPYEGPLEQDFLITRDFLRNTSYIGAQPLQLNFNDGGKRRYTPDFLCKFVPDRHGRIRSPALYEIKPRLELKKKWIELLPGFRRAALLCRARGWRFRIASERNIRTPMFRNIIFLRGYIRYQDQDCIGQILFRRMCQLEVSTPAELLAASFANSQRRMEAVGILWKLVTDGRIRIDLKRPLNMETPIWSVHREGP